MQVNVYIARGDMIFIDDIQKRKDVKRAFIVYTPNGDWRDVFARNADEAKLYVFRLTYGRVPLKQMSANLQFANH